ncbi:sensor histidine kinase [Paeniglutamicibacter sulfureus]|uniref:histidine kinase n=1 Tax=Paeniglutamicibacter sulfureus TaxID=43666 RepID=A0ABU2BIG3_9MICC|nr:histidine kinase [Paeniglutamicibacter sulfureus]MDO2933625.1 histidine kinase [Paeniglutamicibacter sulfureus]MDR7358046.1 signal transduction histidine kinase [Paeniglutamicibacter sulfureus]
MNSPITVAAKEQSSSSLGRKILLVASGFVALLLGTDIVTLLNETDPALFVSFAKAVAVNATFALALGLLWVRTRYAVIVSIVAMTLAAFTGAYLYSLLIIPLLVGLVTLTETRKFSLRYLCITGLWPILIIVVRSYDVGFLIIIIPLVAAAYFIAIFVRKFQEQREADRERIEELRRKQREAVEAERKAIARDLHDIVAHDITVISMQAKAAGFSGDPAVAQAALKVIGATSKEALQDLRVLLNVLRSDGQATRLDGSIVDKAGNAASSLEILIGVEIFAERLVDLGHPTKTMADPKLAGLPQSAQAALYRVLQESTTNIVKHAERDAPCRIEALIVGDRVWLEVANKLPGRVIDQGFDNGGHSSGIVGMADRMAAFGGTLSAQGVRGDWVVRAELPAKILDGAHQVPEELPEVQDL